MKLHELDITKVLKGATHATDMEDHIGKYGWKLLGTGAEALVAQHPHKPYALKLFPTKSKYIYFVKYVQAHQSNPHLPKFGRYTRTLPVTSKHDFSSGRWSYVRMEILQSVSEKQFRYDYVKEMCAVKSLVEQAKKDHPGLWWNPAANMQHLLKSANEMGFESIEACGESADENWKSAITGLLEVMKEHGINQFDLHYGNVMLRDNQLVIVDPFF